MLLTLTAAFGMLAFSRSEPWPLWMTIPSVEEDEGFADFRFSPDSSKLLVWSQNYLQVWDLHSRACVLKQAMPQVMIDCAWAGNSRIIYTSMDDHLRILDVAAQTTVDIPKRVEPRPFQELEANADGLRAMRFAGGRAGAELWDLKSTLLKKDFTDERFSGFSPDGQHFLTRKGEDTLQIHDSKDGRVLAAFTKSGRVFVDEGWAWEAGVIRTAEVEYVDAGTHIQPDGSETKVVEQHFWKVALIWKDGVLKEAERTFNVAVLGQSPQYDVLARRSRKGTAPDGRDIRNTWSVSGNNMSHTLPGNSAENQLSPQDRGDFSPDSSFIACVRVMPKVDVRVRVWNNRRPEAWWGIVWLPESWVTIACLFAALFSLYRDGKSHASMLKTPASTVVNESIASPVQTSPAKAV